MYMVRQRMIKPFDLIILLTLLCTLSSCNPTEVTGKGVKSNLINNNGSLDNKALVYKDSPYILGGSQVGPSNVDMSYILDRTPEVLTENTNLTMNCTMSFFTRFIPVTLSECVRILKNESTSQIVPRNSDRTFIFPTNSSEFYQANTLYHIKKGTDTFFTKLAFAYEKVRSKPNTTPKSIPYYLFDSNLFWFKAMSSSNKKIFNYDYLTTYAQCEFDGNASFSPAGPTLCFGGIKDLPGFYFVQDPSIIYHELGHALVSVMMNMRNGFNSSTYHPLRSNLGSYGYDEAGSLNEGIADYYSYLIQNREMVGEFALGKTYNQARPLSESNSLHIAGIDETSEGRLSYPQFLLYDPNHPDKITEDVHYAGQIVTHYLVALTKNFKSVCNISTDADGGHDKATSYVMLLLAETLSELGDLHARGIDNGSTRAYSPYTNTNPPTFFNNMDSDNSYLWTQVVNQVNYRRFFQIFGKNINKFIAGTGNLCPSFTKVHSERLLDDYGLLLFKTYNNNGNSSKDRNIVYRSLASDVGTQALTDVSEDNRRKSVLVSKQLIELATKTDTNKDRVGFYIIDNSTDMEALLAELLYKGFTVPTSTGVAGTIYNNNNIKVSPGEIIAVIPNLLNKSNSVMAGVQLLATDWDHVDVTDATTGNFKPCVTSTLATFDSATTVDQGGESGKSCTTTEKEYTRLIKNPATGFPLNGSAPVCFVQLDEGGSSRWVSQNEFRKKQGLALQEKDCLGYSTNGNSEPDFSFNPHECLVRFLPGANDAFFSKIDPQKTYYETVVKESSEGVFNTGNILIMEVNKWIPPGTKFRCRLRARFSNCSNCFADEDKANDDYLEHELNGPKPFKVINFDFDIND